MTAPPEPGGEVAARAQDTAAPQTRIEPFLQSVAARLGAPPAEAQRIASSGCLRIDGVDFAARLDPDTGQLEFYGDCGIPRPCDEVDLYRHLLEEALCCEIPGLGFALHPVSRRVVARASLPLAASDEEGWLCASLLLIARSRVEALIEKFSLQGEGHP